LQKRSSAIRTALDRYNSAALALSPPRASLKWDEVVEYAFLSDFDLLHDAHQEIQHRLWATPAGRLAMDTYFKLLRAREEIDRLNAEVRRVATNLRDEDHYLCACEEISRLTDPPLAHQIQAHRMLRGRFKAHHEHCLRGINKMPGFTGTISPGKSLDTGEGACVFTPTSPHLSAATASPLPGSNEEVPADVNEMDSERAELEQEAEDEEEDQALSHDLLDILTVTLDDVRLQD